MHFSYLLHKEIVANDVIHVSSFVGPVCCNHAIDEWRRRLSACVHAEGDILNITYDFCSQTNNVEMAEL